MYDRCMATSSYLDTGAAGNHARQSLNEAIVTATLQLLDAEGGERGGIGRAERVRRLPERETNERTQCK